MHLLVPPSPGMRRALQCIDALPWCGYIVYEIVPFAIDDVPLLWRSSAPRLGAAGPCHSGVHAEMRQYPTHHDDVHSYERDQP